jgi:F0F1-type ATP synthase membrane subunit c/vacuolar-type H+-ATPase subunit K
MSARLPDREHRDGGRLFWVTTGIGWAIIAGAVAGAVADRRDAQPLELVRWVIGAALVHDLLWLPLVAFAGVALTRITRRRLPYAIAWALATSAVLVVVGWPFVRGYGRQRGNPSLLPRSYAQGVAAYLVVIWIVALAIVGLGALRRTVGRARHERAATGLAGRDPELTE